MKALPSSAFSFSVFAECHRCTLLDGYGLAFDLRLYEMMKARWGRMMVLLLAVERDLAPVCSMETRWTAPAGALVR